MLEASANHAQEATIGGEMRFMSQLASSSAYWRSGWTAKDAREPGDIVVIATGPNEIDRAIGPYQEGSCGGADHLDCVRALGRFWQKFDAILDEIELLRAGKPTAIRLVDAANPFLSDPSMSTGLGKDFAHDNAEKHNAICIDVLPILNGPNLDQPVDENSAASFQAITAALLATKLPELAGSLG